MAQERGGVERLVVVHVHLADLPARRVLLSRGLIGMALYPRKVFNPQAHDNYRVILKGEGDEVEVGSIRILKCVPGHYEIKSQA
jgi:hypothetical protein